MDTELLCVPCAEKRQQGLSVEVESVCEECFEYASDEFFDLTKTGGKPEIQIRPEPFNSTLKETPLRNDLGTIVDVAPINKTLQSIWLLLGEDGKIFRLDAEKGDCALVARSSVPSEPNHEPFSGHSLKQRLHASNGGEFVAVVNDYGRYGQIIDLRSGKVTMELDGGEYHPRTVPLSFAFADAESQVIAIHRTSWSRLDFSDPSTGKLLSERTLTSYQAGEPLPEHYLDYFHGALYVNPSGTRVVDDGWIWHPLGAVTTWRLDRWFYENVWESEDGPTKETLCFRDYYWDHGATWLDDDRVVIEGIGDKDWLMVEGARIFQFTESREAGPNNSSNLNGAREVTSFAGPEGKFFGFGNILFSSSEAGLSRWSTEDGARTGHLQSFSPTHHHRGAHELAQLSEGVLLRWSIE